jgi:hypothetical protein
VATIEMVKAKALLSYPTQDRRELYAAATEHMRASNDAWKRSFHWARPPRYDTATRPMAVLVEGQADPLSAWVVRHPVLALMIWLALLGLVGAID